MQGRALRRTDLAATRQSKLGGGRKWPWQKWADETKKAPVATGGSWAIDLKVEKSKLSGCRAGGGGGGGGQQRRTGNDKMKEVTNNTADHDSFPRANSMACASRWAACATSHSSPLSKPHHWARIIAAGAPCAAFKMPLYLNGSCAMSLFA